MRETPRIGASAGTTAPVRAVGAAPPKSKRDSRRRPRLKVSLPVHVRPFDPRFEDMEDVGEVVDFTRDGLYFKTCMPHYALGMRLIVTFPYGEKVSARRKFLAKVARLEDFQNGTAGVAVRFLL